MSDGAAAPRSVPAGWPDDLGPRDLVLLGHPVAHSRSPAIHTAALGTMGVDLRYRALDVPPAALDEALALLDDAGVRGANVTVPHKLAVMPACDRRDAGPPRPPRSRTGSRTSAVRPTSSTSPTTSCWPGASRRPGSS
ncbi:MAG: hypothetical protein ACO3VG_06020 [Nitriliruptoraceae bacterium]